MLYHEIEGPADAPPVVLAGSLGTTLEMWNPQMEALTGHFRVVRFDHRGHGGSPVTHGPSAAGRERFPTAHERSTATHGHPPANRELPPETGSSSIADLAGDVLDLLDLLELPRVSFAGLSLGGMVGMWLAAHAPERIDRLALLCTSARLGTPASWTERANMVREAGTASIAGMVTARWFTPGYSGREPYVTMLGGISAEGYVTCCEAVGAMDLRPDLPLISAPTLVLAGADDPATPPEHAERIAEGIPGSRLVVLPGAAHLANVERPEAVSGHLVEHFLSR
ncbi:alpha/beta fold hydrolase [Streptosporangium sp. G11]|uniref:alpha/beta fold hydrolase n=1 Tax=Streptosporangium sp. G11 TaxID=3436926 RepID=UPI003EBCC015